MNIAIEGNRGHQHEVRTTSPCPHCGQAPGSYRLVFGDGDVQIDGIEVLTQITLTELQPCGHLVRGFTIHGGHMYWHTEDR